MRRFIVVGHRAVTDSSFTLNDLSGSTGRLDVLLRCINSAFFLSHDIRKDVELFLILQGEPEPPKCIRFIGSELRYLNPDERSSGALVRNALAKKVGSKEVRATPGIYISKRSFADIINDYADTQLFYLREDGEDIRSVDLDGELTFILGDERDLTADEERILERQNAKIISVGQLSLHSDHCIIIVHNELDRRCYNH